MSKERVKEYNMTFPGYSSNPKLTESPIYQQWSQLTMAQVIINKESLVTAIGNVVVNIDSLPLLSYLLFLKTAVNGVSA